MSAQTMLGAVFASTPLSQTATACVPPVSSFTSQATNILPLHKGGRNRSIFFGGDASHLTLFASGSKCHVAGFTRSVTCSAPSESSAVLATAADYLSEERDSLERTAGQQFGARESLSGDEGDAFFVEDAGLDEEDEEIDGLAIANLGLARELEQGLANRNIHRLFAIQVCPELLCLYDWECRVQ